MTSPLPAQPAPEVRVAAIVLNYRTPELVVQNLATLVPEIDPEKDRIVVVDNASGDDSVARIRSTIAERGWQNVGLVESLRNGGFAAGNNEGIRSTGARAYLLLNSDTLVRPGAVDSLWDALQSDARIGIVGPRLQWPDDAPQISCFRFQSPWSELIAGSATGPLRRILSRWEVPIPVSDTPFAPDWTTFAAVMIRGEAIREVGLLDEGFFMYYEDADYCRRVHSAGWKVWHDPRAKVVHLRGGTSPVKSLTLARQRRPDYYYASRSRYFRNAYGSAGLVAANLFWTLGRGVSWLRETFGSKPPHTVERELLDIWSL